MGSKASKPKSKLIFIVGLSDDDSTLSRQWYKLSAIGGKQQRPENAAFRCDVHHFDSKPLQCVIWRHNWNLDMDKGAEWNYYCENKDGLIFIVDANNRNGLDETVSLYRKIINNYRDCPVVLFANRTDLPNAMSLEDIKERFTFNENEKAYQLNKKEINNIYKYSMLNCLTKDIFDIILEYATISCLPRIALEGNLYSTSDLYEVILLLFETIQKL
eukprot:275505_1